MRQLSEFEGQALGCATIHSHRSQSSLRGSQQMQKPRGWFMPEEDIPNLERIRIFGVMRERALSGSCDQVRTTAVQ